MAKSVHKVAGFAFFVGNVNVQCMVFVRTSWGYKMSGDAEKTTYQVRVDRALLAEFIRLARLDDRSPAALVRGFMRTYVSTHSNRPAPWSASDKDIPF